MKTILATISANRPGEGMTFRQNRSASDIKKPMNFENCDGDRDRTNPRRNRSARVRKKETAQITRGWVLRQNGIDRLITDAIKSELITETCLGTDWLVLRTHLNLSQNSQ